MKLGYNFGTSIFEPVALAIASMNFKEAKAHTTAATKISEYSQRVIQDIMDDLTSVNS